MKRKPACAAVLLLVGLLGALPAVESGASVHTVSTLLLLLGLQPGGLQHRRPYKCHSLKRLPIAL